MSVEDAELDEGEGAVSGNQASIPAEVRRAADIRDGDRLRWRWSDGELEVEIVRRRERAFPSEFDGFEPEREAVNHDVTGLETAGDIDAGE